MKTCIDQVIHSATRKKEDEINALYFGYNGWFEYILSQTHIKCYMTEKMMANRPYGKLPNTFTILPNNVSFIPNRVDIDVVICNSMSQMNDAANIADVYHIPLIFIQHELPNNNASDNLKKYIMSRLPKRYNQIITNEILNEQWPLDRDFVEIRYGFPLQMNEIRSNKVLVVGDYDVRDRQILHTMMSCHSDTVGLGYNPGITQPYTQFAEVTENMKNSIICVVASNSIEPPIIQLLAMSCGCVVVTNKTRWTERIIEDGKNGFLFENPLEIKKIIRKITNEFELEQISTNAHIYISNNYGQEQFVRNWRSFIQHISKKVYIR